MEGSSPGDGEEPSRLAGRTQTVSQGLGGRAGGGGGLAGAVLPAQRAADLPLGQVVATAGRKVRFLAGGRGG